ncbi:hypothetical protein ROA7450_00787 [Roseovarius albus]|uniref:Uncharacterized protein n=1 Tax=Roseovarius albus TaxID=1247867 RepID=A0A1X6YHK6_9RHOB|nr:hypothetical protein [Roseovarius albus]SLN21720.1 hypothetical protein ROA7450_00787 [Roseovarius albus]
MTRPTLIKTAALTVAALATIASAPAFAQPDPSERQPLRNFQESSENTVTKAQVSTQSSITQDERIARAHDARIGR